jgi:hypothetical protein
MVNPQIQNKLCILDLSAGAEGDKLRISMFDLPEREEYCVLKDIYVVSSNN